MKEPVSPHLPLLLFSAAIATATLPLTAQAQEKEELGTSEDLSPPGLPGQLNWLQYGAALTVESPVALGSVCSSGASAPCILGAGGGLGLRLGWRLHTLWYAGFAYEFSKQEGASLLKLPILQQVRGEGRRYLNRGTRLSPYVSAALGLIGYGSEWRADTYGPQVGFEMGLEFESTRQVYLGLAPAYRVFYLRSWRDQAGQERGGGKLTHFLGLELTLEARSSFARW